MILLYGILRFNSNCSVHDSRFGEITKEPSIQSIIDLKKLRIFQTQNKRTVVDDKIMKYLVP